MICAETASVENLIRLLVERISDGAEGSPAHGGSESGDEDTVFDIVVEGSRYLLIRLPKPAQDDVQLSPREREIVRLVARGHSNKIIADVLSISSWTVCTHLRRIFAKLGVGSRAAMVARVSETGRVSANQSTGRPDSPRANHALEEPHAPSRK